MSINVTIKCDSVIINTTVYRVNSINQSRNLSGMHVVDQYQQCILSVIFNVSSSEPIELTLGQ